MHPILKATAMAAAVALSSTAAHAALFEFSYQFDGGDLVTGLIEGDLQADGNTVILSSIPSWSFGGTAGPALTYISKYPQSGPAVGTASLDGSLLEFLACETSTCEIGIGADSNGYLEFDRLFGFSFAAPLFNAGFPGDMAFDLTYDPKAWRMAAVPLPATLLLLGAAAGLLGAAGRRRPATA